MPQLELGKTGFSRVIFPRFENLSWRYLKTFGLKTHCNKQGHQHDVATKWCQKIDRSRHPMHLIYSEVWRFWHTKQKCQQHSKMLTGTTKKKRNACSYSLCSTTFNYNLSSSASVSSSHLGNRAVNQLPPLIFILQTVDASALDLKPSSCSSFSTVHLRVSFSFPLFLLPSGAQARAVHGISFFSICNTCPIHHHCLLFTLVLMSFVVAFLRT